MPITNENSRPFCSDLICNAVHPCPISCTYMYIAGVVSTNSQGYYIEELISVQPAPSIHKVFTKGL